jgi:hypothetical protein
LEGVAVNRRIVGYEIERWSYNGSFREKRPSLFFDAHEEEKAERIAKMEINLGMKCVLYTLMKDLP